MSSPRDILSSFYRTIELNAIPGSRREKDGTNRAACGNRGTFHTAFRTPADESSAVLPPSFFPSSALRALPRELSLGLFAVDVNRDAVAVVVVDAHRPVETRHRGHNCAGRVARNAALLVCTLCPR